MSELIIIPMIESDTKSFLLNYLSRGNLRMLLSQVIPNQFINNFFDVKQLKMTFMFLPMEKLREITSSDSDIRDEDVIKKITNDFYTYNTEILNILVKLDTSEQIKFIMTIPDDVLREVVDSNNEFAFSYIKNVIVHLDPVMLQKFVQIPEGYEQQQISWVGIR